MNVRKIISFGLEPRKVCENPANLFVAGFIGSPSMNFSPCRMEQNGEHLGLRLESVQETVYKLAVTRWASILEGWQGKEVNLYDPQTQGQIAALLRIYTVPHEILSNRHRSGRDQNGNGPF